MSRIEAARKQIEEALNARREILAQKTSKEAQKREEERRVQRANNAEGVEGRRRFLEYKSDISKLLHTVNTEVLGSRAKIIGWKKTTSLVHWDYGESYGGHYAWDRVTPRWSHQTEQKETKILIPNRGVVGVALLTRGVKNPNMADSTIENYRPNVIRVGSSTIEGVHKGDDIERSIRYCGSDLVPLNNDREDFFDRLEELLLKNTVRVAITPDYK